MGHELANLLLRALLLLKLLLLQFLLCVCVCVCVFKDKSWVFLGENQWENDGYTLLEFCPKEHEQWLSKHI